MGIDWTFAGCNAFGLSPVDGQMGRWIDLRLLVSLYWVIYGEQAIVQASWEKEEIDYHQG